MARTPIHPGKILADELKEAGLSVKRLADVLAVPPSRVHQILVGKRNVTAETGLRLGESFGCWLISGCICRPLMNLTWRANSRRRG